MAKMTIASDQEVDADLRFPMTLVALGAEKKMDEARERKANKDRLKTIVNIDITSQSTLVKWDL